ncbi:hsp70-Hsp90 organising protein-like isoform X2 [Ostrea edulis]|uniref:hsp70-Hsp90 organising protein-like isoform X2 n=1 Tax=Ostrea edulis TaxID=37623 RepID=UPI00209650AE|nr:hsp70-Hsp90 organising protein-like isoform X2 [Ostrea edulis]
MMTAEEVESLKNQGNECIRKENFAEATIHYTHAIQKDAKNHLLYSNRSLAFLKLQQYYYALEDAKETIKLQPYWAKGYFRKGEVLFAVGNYETALLSYEQAFKIEPNDKGLTEAISRTKKEIIKIRKDEAWRPWIWGGGGCLLGVVVVLCDQFVADKPTLQNIILQVLLVAVFCGLSLLLCSAYKFIHNNDKTALLEPPIDLFGGE